MFEKRCSANHLQVYWVVLLLVLIAALMLAGCAGRNDSSQVDSTSDSAFQTAYDFSEFQTQTEFLVKKATCKGAEECSVVFMPLAQEDGAFEINGDAQMLSASIIKLAVLAELLHQADTGAISLEATHTISEDDVVSGSGSLREHLGETYTVGKLAEYMIAESDNTASNVLIELLGIDNINAYTEQLGCTNTNLIHKFMELYPPGSNLTSANDIARFLELIATDQLVSPELSKYSQQCLLAQTDDDGLASGLAEGFTLGNKTGSIDDARHDGGIIYDTEGHPLCLLVVMTSHMGEDVADELMAKICSACCAAMAPE